MYDTVIKSGLPLIIAGDSAGAAITMACTLRARDSGRTLPTTVLLFSLWVDATMTNPGIAEIEPHDPMLGSEGLIWAAKHWAGDIPIEDPSISPINDSLAGLPRISVYQGGHDIFRPDAEAFVAKAQAAGTHADIHIYPDAFHVFVGAPQLPEARAALAHANQIVSTNIDK